MRLILPLIFFAGSLALAQTPAPPPAQTPPPPAPSIVYVAHDPGAINNYKTDPARVRAMVNRLVTAVTNKPDVASAWASLVSPKDKVGIKISAAGGEIFTTHREIVNAIVDGLVAAGHTRDRIVVWDRGLDGAKAAGYSAEGYRLVSIPPRDGYDPKVKISAPVLGKLIWGDYEYIGRTAVPLSDEENTSSDSHFARVLVSDVTKVINVPVMSQSETNGIAGCIYNMTIPNLDNWRRFTHGSRFGAASLAEIYANPLILNKVVLNIMDGLIAEYAGGPAAHPNYLVPHATIYASRDPVALDSMALKKIEEWRKAASLPPISELALYEQAAGEMGLGKTDHFETRNVSP